MADVYMELDDRIGRLEETVAKEFFALNGRMGRLEDRMDAMGHKFEVAVETLEGKIQTVLEHVDALTNEMRRNTEALQKEPRD